MSAGCVRQNAECVRSISWREARATSLNMGSERRSGEKNDCEHVYLSSRNDVVDDGGTREACAGAPFHPVPVDPPYLILFYVVPYSHGACRGSTGEAISW